MIKIKLFIFIFVLSLGNLSHAVTPDYEALFKKSIAAKRLSYKKFGLVLLKKNLKGEWVKVLSAKEKEPMVPASLSKIITGVALLESFGIHEKVPTYLYVDQKPNESQILGNLYIKGHGDPTFVTEKLWLLLNELDLWGVKTITGNLVLDDTVFDQNFLEAGRKKWNQRAYNASISGLPVNWNAVRVRFLDASTKRAVTDPVNPYFDLRIKSNLRKSASVDLRGFPEKEVVSINYGKDVQNKEKSVYRRVVSPRKSFQSQVLKMFRDRGIKIKGKILWSKTPNTAVELGKVESPPMSQIVKLMMKFSNNFIADSMVKYADNKRRNESGVYNQGIKTIIEGVGKAYSFKNPWNFVSASGLSTENKISTQDLANLLKELMLKPYYPEFLVSLPISCTDGTLKDRICNKMKGTVRAKTGLLAGVSSLAGYAKGAGGEDYIFAFIYNGKNGDQFGARQTFDRFLERL
jgi:D-alanyl-D-alanine carboxypeptidase/D-alanyl-D-alanine-endopeptidase (penicillin-binding protein 4)